jgi:hypothetical protein
VDLLLDLLDEALSWHVCFLDMIRHEILNVIRRYTTRRRFLFQFQFVFVFSSWIEECERSRSKMRRRGDIFFGSDGALNRAEDGEGILAVGLKGR